nr:thioredoxin [Methanocalculus alkaliphilus]
MIHLKNTLTHSDLYIIYLNEIVGNGNLYCSYHRLYDQVFSMSRPVLIDFYATWCGPCKMQTPYIEEVGKRLGDAVEIKKLDVDQHMDLAGKYQIQVVPTLIIEKDGAVVHKLEGVTDAGRLMELLKPLI